MAKLGEKHTQEWKDLMSKKMTWEELLNAN